MRTILKALAGITLSITAGVASAGNIFMTGHDVLLHNGQNGYDDLIAEWLWNNEGAKTDYDIVIARGFTGSVGGTPIGTTGFAGFGTVTVRDINDWAALDAAAKANFAAELAGADLLIIPSHQSCGGCDLTTTDADILEGLSAEITAFFNADGDLYVNSGARDATFYDFLPASVATTGLPISGSSGFTCTADGDAIGITGTGCSNAGLNMINGFQTHNRFTDFDSDFTVFETRGTEIISIGLLDGIIGTDDISTDDSTDSTDGTTDVPVPGTLFLFSAVLLGLGAMRRRA